MFKKFISILLLLLVGFMAISSASAFFGIGEGDLVEVIDVGIYDDYSGGGFGGAIDSSIAAREDWADLEGDDSYHMDFVDSSGNEVSGSSTPSYDINLGIVIDFKAKETIEDVNEITIKNYEVTYQDGSVQKLDNFTFSVDGDIVKDDNFTLSCQYELNQSLWNESIKLKDFYGNAHVKGDVYVYTETDADKLIGHIDNDVTKTG